jgi:hypothetical protein
MARVWRISGERHPMDESSQGEKVILKRRGG